MSDEKPTALVPTDSFPESVQQSLAELRQLAKSVRSFEEWKAIGRKATPEEVALSERLRKPNACKGHSRRTGLACEKPASRSGMCRTHGAGAPQVVAKHKRELERRLPKALRTLDDALEQRDHWPTALNAVKEVHDRTLGPVKGNTSESGKGVRIILGIGFARKKPTAIDAEVIEVNDEE